MQLWGPPQPQAGLGFGLNATAQILCQTLICSAAALPASRNFTLSFLQWIFGNLCQVHGHEMDNQPLTLVHFSRNPRGSHTAPAETPEAEKGTGNSSQPWRCRASKQVTKHKLRPLKHEWCLIKGHPQLWGAARACKVTKLYANQKGVKLKNKTIHYPEGETTPSTTKIYQHVSALCKSESSLAVSFFLSVKKPKQMEKLGSSRSQKSRLSNTYFTETALPASPIDTVGSVLPGSPIIHLIFTSQVKGFCSPPSQADP